MLPFYFGPSGGRLFGAYHPPDAQARPAGVLLCPPMGHEYIRAHRALRQLAVQLARDGFPVLRFDYFGSGDSAGDADEGRLVRWTADVNAAIDELKDATSVSSVIVIGVRLGATAALMATADRTDVARLILWDPVLDGRAYLRELARLQRRWLKGRPGSRLFSFHPRVDELIGFPMPHALRREIEALGPASLPRGCGCLDVVASQRHDEYAAWLANMPATTGRPRCHRLPIEGDWDRREQVHTGMSASAIVPYLSRLLAEDAR